MPPTPIQQQPPLRLKLLILGGCILTIIIVFVVINARSASDPVSIKSAAGAADYEKLKQEIDQLSQSPWNPFAYNALRNRIEISAQATPTALITDDQKKQLLGDLLAGYFLLFKTSAEKYLRTANVDTAKPFIYMDELKKFPAGYQNASIKILAVALHLMSGTPGLHQSIDDYTSTQAYDATTSNTYQSRINETLQNTGLRNNVSIGNLLGTDIQSLNLLQKHAELFQSLCHDKLLSTIHCDQLLPNRYYSNKCQIRDCQ